MPIGRKTKKRLQSVSRKNKRSKSKKIGLGRKKIGGLIEGPIKFRRDAPLNSAYKDQTTTEIIRVMESNGLQLKYVDKAFKNNEDIVLAAVTENGLALEFADDSLKSNEAIVLAAVRQNRLAFEFADDSLKSDKAFVLAAVTQNGLALKFAHDSLKSNEDIVLAAVRQNRSAFKFADRSLKKTIETRLTDEATTSCYGDGVVSATCSNIANIMEAFF